MKGGIIGLLGILGLIVSAGFESSAAAFLATLVMGIGLGISIEDN